MKDMIYLDHNATTFLKPNVMDSIISACNLPRNPSSIHHYGRNARKLIEQSRRNIFAALNIKNHRDWRIIFTSSGTEANNMIIHGIKADHFLCSSIEHFSVLKPIESKKNYSVLKVDANGLIDVEAFKYMLENIEGKKLVSIIHANNETGIIQNLKLLKNIAADKEVVFHTDAVQSFGKIDLNFEEILPDLMTISSHKIGGPQGAAAIVMRKSIDINPMILGGGQELGARSGTENVLAISGFGKAVENLKNDIKSYSQIKNLRDYLENKITAIAPEAILVNTNLARLPNTTVIAMPGMKSETQVINFDLQGIMISAGSACSSGKVSSSHVLKNMGIDDELIESSIRVSIGANNTKQDIDRFIDVWREIFQNMKGIK